MTHHKPETKKRRSGLWLPDRSLSVILFLIFLFGVFSVIYTDSTNASQEEQRRLAYGSWHIAAYDTDQETCRLFQSHATVQTAGYMEIYGSIAKAPGQTEPVLGSIGYADPNALAVGSIVLLNGRLPNTKNEIAVEADALRRLGLSGTLGQQLTLAVFPSDVRSAPRAAIQTYQLCGIVRNYSKNWKTDGYPLPSFFVCKNSPDATEPALLHVFAQMKPAFAANAAELSSLCSWHSYFVQNDFTYPQYGKEPDPAPLFSVLQMILLLSGALLTLTLMQADIRQRSHSLLILRTLGASRAQIFHFFLREKARLIGSSSGPGILCGILLAYLVSLPPGLLAGPDICSIRIPHLIKMVFCLYAGVILASAASLGSLLHMPLKNASCRQVRKTRFRRRTKKHPDTIACLFRASDRRYHFFQTMLTFAAAVFLFIPVYRALHAGNAYLQYQNDFPEDYTFGTLSSAPPHSTITEDALLQIRETYGVKDTMAVSVSGSCRIRALDSGNRTKDTDVWGMLIGCEDGLLLRYSKETDSGSLGKKLAPDEILLYLPEDRVSADHSFKEIYIDTDKGEKKLTVAGIIRSFSDSLPKSYRLPHPYSILCSQDTYRSIWGRSDYAFVQIFQDDTSIAYQTAAELSHQENGLYFHNKRIERVRLLQELISQTMLALLLCTSVFLAAMSIRLEFDSFYGKQLYERYRILHRLGMSKKELQKMLFRKAFLNSLTGCGAAAFVFWNVCNVKGSDLWAVLLTLGGFVLNWMLLFAYDNRYVSKGFS